jgi:hypothetical protein
MSACSNQHEAAGGGLPGLLSNRFFLCVRQVTHVSDRPVSMAPSSSTPARARELDTITKTGPCGAATRPPRAPVGPGNWYRHPWTGRTHARPMPHAAPATPPAAAPKREARGPGRRKGAKPLSAAQPRLPSEARGLLPGGVCRGGDAPAPAPFSGLRGRGDAATLLKLRASSFSLPSLAPQYDLRLRRQPRLCRGLRGFAQRPARTPASASNSCHKPPPPKASNPKRAFSQNALRGNDRGYCSCCRHPARYNQGQIAPPCFFRCANRSLFTRL